MISRMWDWIDKRQIDKHVVSVVVLYGTKLVTEWAIRYADAHYDNENGMAIAAIIAAVTTPYMALQAASIKFYFDSRNNNVQ